MPDNVQGGGNTAVTKTDSPDPCTACPASGKMGFWTDIPEIIANYNHGRCFEIQL